MGGQVPLGEVHVLIYALCNPIHNGYIEPINIKFTIYTKTFRTHTVKRRNYRKLYSMKPSKTIINY